MNVTIFSDASICPATRSGGWAGWIKSDRGVLEIDGQFKVELLDTTIAEAMAALNCICYAISQKMILEGDLVVLATDNDNVLEVLEGRSRRKFRRKDAKKRGWTMKELRLYVKNSNEHINRVANIFERKLLETGIDFRWNHVKGHRGTVDRRSAVNHGCDRRARNAMRRARKESKRAS